MKTAILVCLAAMAPPVAAQGGASPARLAGMIETWRSAPEEVVTVCNHASPGQAGARDAMLAAWKNKHASLIQRVDDQFAEVARMLDPIAPPEVDVAAKFRAELTAERMRQFFVGRTPEDVTEICGYLTHPAHMMWGDGMVAMVEDALVRLEQWKASRQ